MTHHRVKPSKSAVLNSKPRKNDTLFWMHPVTKTTCPTC